MLPDLVWISSLPLSCCKTCWGTAQLFLEQVTEVSGYPLAAAPPLALRVLTLAPWSVAGKWARNKYVGVSLVDKTLAVMGFGKVGSEVARRAKGLGMKVIAHDPYAPADRARAIGVELVSFDDALAAGDFFSLHMPLTPTTDKLFNDETFAKMKRGARIINVARGGVIDEPALVRALDSGIVAQVRRASGRQLQMRKNCVVMLVVLLASLSARAWHK